MKIVIFGASGKTGHHLVTQALDQGHLVTAFVRDPGKLTIQNDQLRVVQGNVSNEQKVTEAIKGQQAVFSALGADSPFKYDPIVVEGMKNIINSMKTEKVE